MTAPTVPVTCAASDQGGSPVAGALYTARLNSTEIYQGFIVPEIVRGTADANGICVLNLWPNALGVAGSLYDITATNPDTGKKFLKETVAVPNAPCNLHEILVTAPYPTLDAAAQALIGVQAVAAAVGQQVAGIGDIRDGAVLAAASSLEHALASAESRQGAADSAVDAAGSATASAGSAATAKHIYPGTYATNPVARPDGSAVQAGDSAFIGGLERRYNGATWQASDINTELLEAQGGSALIGHHPEGEGAVPATVKVTLNRGYTTPEAFGAVADANEATGLGTDSTVAVQAAIKYCENKGTALLLLGKYLITGELVIRKPLKIIGMGAGAGYGGPALTGYAMRSGFVVNGAAVQRIRTRVKYRASAADPQDDPLSVALNVQAEFVTLEDFAVYLWFDRASAAPTNYGAAWDVGIFNGCRVHMSLNRMHVVGYWRQADVLLDVTRATGWPEFSDPQGVPFNPGTVYNGADGLTLTKYYGRGGKWSLKIQGAEPKPGLDAHGSTYKVGATITVTGAISAGDTLTLAGTVFTFTSAPATAQEIGIGGTTEESAVLIAAAVSQYIEQQIESGAVVGTKPVIAGDTISTGSSVFLFQRTDYTLELTYSLSKVSAGLSLSGTTVAALADPAPYYDELTGTTKTDIRGTFGASDVTAEACSFYGTDHHSNWRRNDASGNVATDTAGGAVSISGMNASGRIQGMRFVSCRFATWEPFKLRLDRANRVQIIGCHMEGRASSSVRSTTGVKVDPNSLVFDGVTGLLGSYGNIATTQNTRRMVVMGGASNMTNNPWTHAKTIQTSMEIGSSSSTAVHRFPGRVEATTLTSPIGELDLRAATGNAVRFRSGSLTLASVNTTSLTFSGNIPSPIIQAPPAGGGTLDLRGGTGGAVTLRGGSTVLANFSAAEGFKFGGSSVANVSSGATAVDLNLYSGSAALVRIGHGTTGDYLADGISFRPAGNNSRALGTAGAKWTEVFAGNAAINTSDARLKQLRGDGALSAQELGAWANVRPVVFQWIESLARKGGGARLNVGYLAQQVAEAFTAVGLDPSRYALWCEDPVITSVTKTRTVQRPVMQTLTESAWVVEMVAGQAIRRQVEVERQVPAVTLIPLFNESGQRLLDEEGNPDHYQAPVTESVIEEYSVEEATGETRMGLRYEQCLVFECAYLRSVMEGLL